MQHNQAIPQLQCLTHIMGHHQSGQLLLFDEMPGQFQNLLSCFGSRAAVCSSSNRIFGLTSYGFIRCFNTLDPRETVAIPTPRWSAI